jgi:hypothetical protein
MRTKIKEETINDLRPEYDLGELLKTGVRGKYAERYKQGTNLILLEPDVAEAFPDGTSVNEALRLVIRLREIPARAKRLVHKA